MQETDMIECLNDLVMLITGEYEKAIIAYNDAKPDSRESCYFFGQIEKLSFIITYIPSIYEHFGVPKEHWFVDKETSDKGLGKLKAWPKPRIKGY